MRIARALVLVLMMLGAPAVAIAARSEPRLGAPVYGMLSGSDSYGSVTMEVLSTTPGGAPKAIGKLVYANSCSSTGTTVLDVKQNDAYFLASVTTRGLFAWSTPGAAVSGIVTVKHGTYSVRGSVQSAHTCAAQTGPVTFTLTGRSLLPTD